MNTYFQKNCDLPNESKFHIVQLHGRTLYNMCFQMKELPVDCRVCSK